MLAAGCFGAEDADTEQRQAGLSAVPAFVQVNAATPQSPQATVALPFNAAQTAGNLNVAIVGWNDTVRSVTSITDSRGNVYQLAIGPTRRTGVVSQSIYYAKNIVAAGAGANTLTVVFDGPAEYIDIRIAEYSGIDPVNPVDVTVGSTGSSPTSSSGAVTTTNADDLLVAGNMVTTYTRTPGSGYTTRIITSQDGDILQDRVVNAVGSNTATAALNGTSEWVMQLVAFRAAIIGGDTQAPTPPTNLTATPISSNRIDLSWTAATDDTGVTSYMIERCQGAGCSNFTQIGTTAGPTTFMNTGLAVNTSYSYRVRAADAAGNVGGYSNTASATTLPDTQPPIAPSNLVATAVSAGQINLTWTAATDDVGVTAYLIERCEGAGCTGFASVGMATGTTFSNSGLTAGVTYGYRVRASDLAGNLGAFSNTASATTPAPDSTPPTAPSNLAATAPSSSQINLTWTASTDNVGVASYLVERCQGAGCTSFAQIAAPTGTTFGDSGLASGTSYSYRVRAADATGNLSAFSNTASATTVAVDSTPPTAPSNLVATAPSTSQINLTWTASTDNVGVTQYRIERCQGAGCTTFAQIATATTLSFGDTGLAASTSYSYRVRAADAAGNLSAFSNTASATTQTPSGTPQTPTYVQGNYACPQSPQASVAVAYTAAQTAGDLNVIVVGWNDTTAQVASVTDSAGNSYALAVGPSLLAGTLSQSIYYAKNIAAAAANTVTVTFNTAAIYADVRVLQYRNVDKVNPVDVVATGTGTSTSPATGAVTTTNPTDLLVGAATVTSYVTGPGTGFTNRMITVPDMDIAEDRVVTTVGSYSATAALGGTGSWIMQMVAFRALVIGSDTQAPTPPSNLTATVISSGRIDLAWTASTDDTGVTGYQIERCTGAGCTTFAQVGTAPGTSFSNTGLSMSTAYSYRVRAADAAGNVSGPSNEASGTTPGDTQAPTAPTNVVTTVISANQINLAWTASTDDVGVTNYFIERCWQSGQTPCTNFAQVGTTAGTTFNNTGLVPNWLYLYRIRATDAAGNLSDYSAIASGLTPPVDTQAPTAPANLAATATSNTQISLTWTASTDNVGVTSYLIERCQGTGCTGFAQIATATGLSFGDSGLAAATPYSYRVRASDAAGNQSAFSNTASATTQAGAPQTPTYVQGNFACPQTAQTTVAVTYTGAQAAGDLNVVVVGWNDTTAQVASLADSAGNSYALAVGPTPLAGTLTQSIYYAKNIAPAGAGTNTVTVTFTTAAIYADIRILQYHGIDAVNPVDVVATGTGTGTSTSTSAVTTTNPTDLLFGAATVTSYVTAAGTGFTSRMITVPDSDIAEDRVVTAVGSYNATAPLGGSGGWVIQMVAFRAAGSGSSGDTTPPVVSITSPTSGATLTGTVTVSVSATDASGIASVQLYVDGGLVGSPDTTSPYQFSLATATFPNGAHSIGAAAIDPSGNTGNATPVPVTFSNNVQGQSGQWSGSTPLPIVSVNMALLGTGNILMYDGASWGWDARVWNPSTGTNTAVASPSNMFCSGLEQMGDGRILVAGGHAGNAHLGIVDANIFNPATNTWTPRAAMANPRWYPTVAVLPDSRMLVVGGENTCNFCNVTVAEIYDPAANSWSSLSSIPKNLPYYPHLYLLPDGKIFIPATAREPIVSQLLDLTALSWTNVGGPAVDGGSSVMYAPGKFLKTGTSVDPDQAQRPAANTAYVIDMNQPSPTWRAVAPMAFARTYHTLTMLPDGNVLCTAGGPTTAPTATGAAILPAELWNPVTETWTTLAPMNVPRLYHSEALLMPDARVLVAGGGRFDDLTAPTDQFSAEFFSPPYLFNGTRPVITSAPANLTPGQVFSIQTAQAAQIAKVSLLRYGAVTHAINVGQRFLPLSFTAGAGTLTVTAPATANLAPPGNYLLFIVDSNGVPSVASTVRF